MPDDFYKSNLKSQCANLICLIRGDLHVMRFWSGLFMMGLGFCLGLLLGLFVQLPVDTLPASSYEEHHLARVRRSALLSDPRAGEPGLIENIVDNYNRLSDLDSPTAQGKQSRQSDIAVDYSPSKEELKLLDNSYKLLKGEKSAYLNSLNQFPHKNSESLVYVNPLERKLVYNNNSTDPNHGKRRYEGTNILRKPVINDRSDKAGYTNTEVLPGQDTPPGDEAKSDKIFRPDNQNKVSITNQIKPNKGIFWSEELTQICPHGFTDHDHAIWKTKASSEKFVKMGEGCGRMQNRKLTFQDGDRACARYRLNIDQIQGEIFSYYLGKLLGINNVPPSAVQLADTTKDQWRMVSPELANAQWSEEKPVILTQWMEGLNPSYIPEQFRNLSKTVGPETLAKDNTDTAVLCKLMQWSDLIVFDYLTANLDRVVNNLFNLQWNDQMMSKPTHNLEETSSGNLVFLDNESGLFHGYRLLDKYSPYHNSLLHSLCLFKETTIKAIQNFVQNDNIGEVLQRTLEENEALHTYIPKLPMKNVKILKQRLNDVLNQYRKCESQYR